MNPLEITTLVDRGLTIVATIDRLQTELKQIETELAQAAYVANTEGRVEPLKDSKREGRRWLACGSTRILPVLFTADKLVTSFAENGEVHQMIAPCAGGHLPKFFKRIVKYENRFASGVKFRATAGDLLGRKAAPAFITACLARDKSGLPRSDIKFEWERTEPLQEPLKDAA